VFFKPIIQQKTKLIFLTKTKAIKGNPINPVSPGRVLVKGASLWVKVYHPQPPILAGLGTQ